MLSISSLTQRLGSVETVKSGREIFPPPVSDFAPLFEAHGMEVRGKPFRLDYKRYADLEFEGRLVWIVARVNRAVSDEGRHGVARVPVGYSCSWWYRDMHFDERCAADDLWYVVPQYRRQGIGRQLKGLAHSELHKAGVARIGDNIRTGGVPDEFMFNLGFTVWGARWIKTFPGSSGN
jgi:GNAT superfamily N-acetyltransferase